MGIYLPNMEIPKDTFLIIIGPDGTVDVRRNDALTWLTLKDKAVFVPAHGRLIDADALREDWLENGENEYVYDTNAFLDSLDSAPTVIPAEEGE